MVRTLDEAGGRAFDGLQSGGPVRAGRPLARSIDPSAAFGSLDLLAGLETDEEHRRLSAAGAFFMYMLGVGSGVFWSILLTWLF